MFILLCNQSNCQNVLNKLIHFKQKMDIFCEKIINCGSFNLSCFVRNFDVALSAILDFCGFPLHQHQFKLDLLFSALGKCVLSFMNKKLTSRFNCKGENVFHFHLSS